MVIGWRHSRQPLKELHVLALDLFKLALAVANLPQKDVVLLFCFEFDRGVGFCLYLLNATEEDAVVALNSVDALFVKLNGFRVVYGHAPAYANVRVEDGVEVTVTPLTSFRDSDLMLSVVSLAQLIVNN